MKNVHFIGICGKGMSAVAKLLIDQGYTVSGSDEGFYPPVSTYIEKNNIPFIKGYKKENISEEVDTVVIGKHASLTEEENEEVKYAFELRNSGKVEIKSFPEVVEKIVEGRESLVVAGSYGKSTCTSLLAYLLESNGLDVGYLIGATPTTPAQNAKLGTDKYFVLEGDEYPSANWDKTSKFMYYKTHDLLLTALAHDHVNIFKTHADFKKPFLELIKSLPEEGVLVMCSDEKSIQDERENIFKLHKNTVQYSLEDNTADYYVQNIVYGEVTTFDLYKKGDLIAKLSTKLLGSHNIQNIIGVCALVLEKNLLTAEQIQNSLLTFEAVEGRLNQLKTLDGFKIFEGFGSSVDKAKSAIDAIRLHFPSKNLKIIFEPHTFSWRNLDAIAWYDEVFLGARKVYVYEPPTHGAGTITQLTQEQIVDRIAHSGVDVVAINDKKQAIDMIMEELDLKNDIILTLSSSNIAGIPAELAVLV